VSRNSIYDDILGMLTRTHSCIGHLVSKATYGDQIWKEMGEDLSHWNMDILVIINEALFSFWLVDVFNFCKCGENVLSKLLTIE
jgi:hypothetical protein